MKTWFSADLHLGEDRMELMGRPFLSMEDHIECIMNNFNTVVAPDDLVIINGDVCYQKSPQYLSLVAELNGRKTLVRGNHDRVFTDEQLKPYFEEIVPEGDGIMMDGPEFNGKPLPLWITHYPSRSMNSRFNLVGHIHSSWKVQKNMLNVGVDVHHFRPVNLEKIPFFLSAITSFYDEDVWVADHPANSMYNGMRGKTGTYFTP